MVSVKNEIFILPLRRKNSTVQAKRVLDFSDASLRIKISFRKHIGGVLALSLVAAKRCFESENAK